MNIYLKHHFYLIWPRFPFEAIHVDLNVALSSLNIFVCINTNLHVHNFRNITLFIASQFLFGIETINVTIYWITAEFIQPQAKVCFLFFSCAIVSDAMFMKCHSSFSCDTSINIEILWTRDLNCHIFLRIPIQSLSTICDSDMINIYIYMQCRFIE